ncbi:SlyX family protein [Legionella micdadei]|nr:SlyX family protein [Legionella micdadei]KTD27502.1 hypothetical protein Lmic_2131 [Legionella micdadei]SCY70095.1 hypothetical protein SAMN02982997_02559 [Legionella micdadei]
MTNKKGSTEVSYSGDTRLALLEHTINDINKTLERFEKRFDRLEEKIDSQWGAMNSKIDSQSSSINSKIDGQNSSINSKIDSHYRTTINMLLGLYGGVIAVLVTAIGKAYHWF